ncbi:GNAT family N-acetyltransferase [Ferrovibrio xuzhouensis]|uniref:GNAT family N-acetyltransferase n=1 Tax=Ferrovibrio xuzhouensis TaxID=1576914 RepID=A0ABV7VIE7_9PROT
MADALVIDRLSEADLPGLQTLSAEAGWNQTMDDWRIFLGAGQVFGCREAGRLLASAAILPYGAFAWISMVLVTATARRLGLGTGLLRHCIAELRRMGLVPLLDATAAGEKIYIPLGFRPLYGITRWQGQGQRSGRPDDTAVTTALPLNEAGLADAIALDAAVCGAPREGLLRSLQARAPHLALRLKQHSILLARPGRLATQIGPLAANDEAAAIALLQAALARIDGPVFLDVPEQWTGIAAELQQRGFSKQRGFRRMVLDRDAGFGDPGRSFVIAGPEFG